MKPIAPIILSIIGLGYATVEIVHATPPFSGTIFLDPDIIRASDTTTYQSIVGAGRGVGMDVVKRNIETPLDCAAARHIFARGNKATDQTIF